MIGRLPKFSKQKQIPKVNKRLIPIVGAYTIKFRNNYMIVLSIFIVFVHLCLYQYVSIIIGRIGM